MIIKVTMEMDVSATQDDTSVTDEQYAIMQAHRFLQEALTSCIRNHMNVIEEFAGQEISKAMYDASTKIYKEEKKMLEHMMRTLKVVS